MLSQLILNKKATRDKFLEIKGYKIGKDKKNYTNEQITEMIIDEVHKLVTE